MDYAGQRTSFRCEVNLTFIFGLSNFRNDLLKIVSPGQDVNFCSNLPRRASEIQFSLALLQLSLALEKL